jgi:hypothetical protein
MIHDQIGVLVLLVIGALGLVRGTTAVLPLVVPLIASIQFPVPRLNDMMVLRLVVPLNVSTAGPRSINTELRLLQLVLYTST